MGHSVVVLDLSLSMPIKGLWMASKSAAMDTIGSVRRSGAAESLDGVVGFGEVARVLDPDLLDDLEWDYVYGSNLAGALDLAAEVVKGGPGRFVVFTDLVPTAHYLPDGTSSFSCPTSPETVTETVKAIARVGEAGITLEVHRFFPAEEPREGPRRSDERLRDADREAMRATVDAIQHVGGSIREVSC
jgi:uncharacterized protein with von Willebrand factor type A (vWA) domain